MREAEPNATTQEGQHKERRSAREKKNGGKDEWSRVMVMPLVGALIYLGTVLLWSCPW